MPRASAAAAGALVACLAAVFAQGATPPLDADVDAEGNPGRSTATVRLHRSGLLLAAESDVATGTRGSVQQNRLVRSASKVSDDSEMVEHNPQDGDHDGFLLNLEDQSTVSEVSRDEISRLGKEFNDVPKEKRPIRAINLGYDKCANKKTKELTKKCIDDADTYFGGDLVTELRGWLLKGTRPPSPENTCSDAAAWGKNYFQKWMNLWQMKHTQSKAGIRLMMAAMGACYQNKLTFKDLPQEFWHAASALTACDEDKDKDETELRAPCTACAIVTPDFMNLKAFWVAAINSKNLKAWEKAGLEDFAKQGNENAFLEKALPCCIKLKSTCTKLKLPEDRTGQEAVVLNELIDDFVTQRKKK